MMAQYVELSRGFQCRECGHPASLYDGDDRMDYQLWCAECAVALGMTVAGQVSDQHLVDLVEMVRLADVQWIEAEERSGIGDSCITCAFMDRDEFGEPCRSCDEWDKWVAK